MTNLEFTKIVVFSVLVQKGAGLMSKSPDQIIDKFDSCMNSNSTIQLLGLLDYESRVLVAKYLTEWRV